MTHRSPPPSDDARVGVAALVSLPEFRRLWIAGGLAGTMRWLEALAVGLWVLDATGSPLLVAIALGARQSPMLFGPLVGTLADRLGRRRTLSAILALVTLNAAAMWLLHSLGMLGLPHIIVGAFINGFQHAAEYPVRRAMLGDTVPRAHVGPALSLDSATTSMTRALGPFLGATIYAGLGIGGAFAASASLYALACLLILRAAYTPATARERRQGLVETLRAGVAFVRADRLVAGTLLVTAIANFFAFPFASMIPVIGRDRLDLTDTFIGVLSSAEGTAALIGAIFIVRFARPAAYGRLYTAGTAIFLVGVAVFSRAPDFALAYAALFAGGFAVAGFAAMQGTLVFLSAPAEIRSRVMGMLTLSIGVQPFGVLHVGWLAEKIGASNAVLVIAIEGMAALALTCVLFPALVRSTANLVGGAGAEKR